jgi:nicotinic acid mononucleotide adenylyltransferase
MKSDFLDDGLEEATDVRDIHWLGTPYGKIVDNLARVGEGRKAVLLSTGSFNPLHEGHLHMMNLARAYLESEGVRVVGGYFSPSHDRYVSTKYSASDVSSAAQRIHQAQQALSSSSWLMVDAWEAALVGYVNFTDVLEHIESYLGRLFGGELEVYYVFGSDNAGMLRALGAAGNGICITRPGFPVPAGLHAEIGSGIVLEGGLNMSSTQIGHGHASEPGRPKASSGDATYVVNDDLEFAVRDWDVDRGVAERFHRGLHEALSEALTGVAEVVLLPAVDVEAAMGVLGDDVISVNGVIPAKYNLGVSRVFDLAGGQINAKRLDMRPESAPRAEQIAAIPPGRYVLADDDSLYGATLSFAKGLLDQAIISGEWLGVEHFVNRSKMFDIVDGRDFLLGAKLGGLVVEAPQGTLMRAPYLWPYVTLWSRASIGVDECISFSRKVWALNAAFFCESEMTVGDLASSTISLLLEAGWGRDTPVVDVIAWHIDRCDQALG